jgi:AP2-like factor (ANT lineage)
MSRYDVKSILESSTLPIGGAAKRLKDVEAQAEMITVDGQRRDHHDTITDGINSYGHQAAAGWPTLAFQQPQQTPYVHYPYGGGGGQRVWCKQEQDSSDHTSFQDLHQLQLGNTHNFFHQNSVLHNLMGMESAAASMEHSNGGVGYHGNGGYVIPMSTVIGNDGGNNNGFVGQGESDDQVKALGYENHVFPSSTDAYHASRNVYYHLSQQSSPAVVKATAYDQGSTCNTWVPTAVPTVKQYGCTLPWTSNVHSLE